MVSKQKISSNGNNCLRVKSSNARALLYDILGNLLFDGYIYAIKYFNLPERGDYSLHFTGKLKIDVLPELLPIPLPELPTPDYNRTGETVIKVARLSGFASIDTNKRIIYVNGAFSKLPYYMRFFILSHEKGHLLYDSEENADLYALWECARAGIPLSMCLKTQEYLLTHSGENLQRKQNIIKILRNL